MGKTIERELTETECNELLDHELDTVTGGSFFIGDIVGGVVKAVLPSVM